MNKAIQPSNGFDNDYPYELHYQIEKILAGKLKNAGAEERRMLYSKVYDNLFQIMPFHISLKRKNNPELKQKAVQSQLNILNRFVKSDSWFMEIGAGGCDLALAIASRVGKVFALEVSTAAIDEKKTPSNFRLVLFDGLHIPFDDKSMDIAYSYQVLEHLHPDDVMVQISDIYRVLKPGGIFICVTPNRIFGPFDISKFFDERATGLHLKEYTTHELSGIFKKAGFKRVKKFVMAGQKPVFVPQFYLKTVEGFLDRFSKKKRWGLANFLPIKILLGGSNIYLMAVK
ncbi:MAG TPA: class I SAM-dependent methyltransferase [Candidatus Sumerlaeota bacterium]|nr:MAG: putative S-adenosylmethionine-dependent methyltransferase [candidate division BRC1 bacterium ADurb.Bin183]HQH11263.1 class I SAM-dependent methyltransferase [Candidatus Sumerlaeota bacterium]